MKQLILRISIICPIFILIMIIPAYACSGPVILFNKAEFVAYFSLLTAFVAISTIDYKYMIRDMLIFVLVVTGIFFLRPVFYYFTYLPVYEGALAAFTVLYCVRVWMKSEKDRRFRWLYSGVPILIFITLFTPPPIVRTGCPSRCSGKVEAIGEALAMYKSTNGSYPDDLGQAAGYIKSGPYVTSHLTCKPLIHGYDKWKMKPYRDRFGIGETPYLYEVNSDNSSFTVSCQSNNHTMLGFTKGFPQYSSSLGSRTYP